MDRSYLFAPGHNAKLLGQGLRRRAPTRSCSTSRTPSRRRPRTTARAMVAARSWPSARRWVRVNAPRTAAGARPTSTRSRGAPPASASPRPSRPRTCSGWPTGRPACRSSARSRAPAGCSPPPRSPPSPACGTSRMGGVDLRRDLNAGGGNLQTLYVRSHLVVVSRAAGIEPPIDSVYPHLDDDAGLREQAEFARSLGFFGKSAIHPRQLPVLHEVFTPTERGGRLGARGVAPSTRPAARRCGCRAASSSTCPSPSAPGACSSWPGRRCRERPAEGRWGRPHPS